MDSTAIATTMPPGRYGARHIARCSVSVASCEATMLLSGVCSRRIGPADAMVIAVAVV
jgi:hypothetical protein